ncbi:MAG: HlyC/CorC family transporter [Verrucomicrobiota bacterium]|nr:HlyC/CorC family transporter [Verrucomicrobiota bacterium]
MTASLLVLLIFLILCSGFLSGSETALFSLSSLQLKCYKQSKEPRLEMIARMMEHPRDVLVTILMLNVLANILVQNTVSSIFDAFPDWSLRVGVPLVLTLIFGEIIPKSIAIPFNAPISYRIAPWIGRIAYWLGPLRRVLTRTTSAISRVLFLFLREEEEISSEELQHVLKTSEESGVLLEQESRLVGGALELQQTLVKERMRPREEILYYDIKEPLLALLHLLVDQEATRVPVCDGKLENLIGILSTRRFFLEQPKIQTSQDVVSILRKPYYVPETTKAFTLLKLMRERSESLGIVVDEYGSISGLVTQEDLIEGVVGEIADLRDAKSLYTPSGEDVIIASGKLELSQFKEIFGVELESENTAVTLGGFLIQQLGDIPETGTRYATDQFLFYVLAADPNRVRRVYVRRLAPPLKKEL